MKKYFIALTLLLTLGASAPTAAQTHKKQAQKELVDSSSTGDEFEAFSDTTLASADSDTTASSTRSTITTYADWDDEDKIEVNMDRFFKRMDADNLVGMAFALVVILIIFIFSPLVIFGLLLFFIFRNRRQKMKLAEMAVKNGQPIPDQLLRDQPSDAKDAYQSGMRQLFLGIGLMIFLGFTVGKIGIGIGALVFFIGVGKVAIGRKSQNNVDSFLNNNQSNNQRYE